MNSYFMKVLQINTTYNIGSTGRIVSGIDEILTKAGIESYVAYGYGLLRDKRHYRIINKFDSYCHNLMSRLTDGQGLYSTAKTRKFIKCVDKIEPDIIHLHNLHGNYFNYRIFFEYLRTKKCKVVWTLHDCWPFTGHCAYFDMANCDKWQDGCDKCPQVKCYPPAMCDNSTRNYELRRKLFTALGDRLVLVPVSNWLSGLVKKSFFKHSNVVVIHNGINLRSFVRNICKESDSYILGVAAPWDTRKGLKDFYKLREILPTSIGITLVGLTSKQIKELPCGITGIERTESIAELTQLYSGAIALINTTYEDNYPTVNIEAIACGTPVVTYQTCGSPESVNDLCGIVVPQGDVLGLKEAIEYIKSHPNKYRDNDLIAFAAEHFDQNKCFSAYLKLYKNIEQ